VTFLKKLPRPLVIGVGLFVTLLGAVLMPVPGPGGTPVFLAGLAILATEFHWARNILSRFKEAHSRMDKRKRLALTFTLLAFYTASGMIAWNLSQRSEPADLTGSADV
jgi:uncharacterized protein (TIGR02611 family)